MAEFHKFFFTTVILLFMAFSLKLGGVASLGGAPRAFREGTPPSAGRPAASRQTERLRRVMLPLLRATNNPKSLSQVRMGIVQDNKINAATAGNGTFYVTSGLLDKATDNQLRGVLAHEIAHEDLGHPARAQMLNAGLHLGAALMERVFPGSGAVAPLAGVLIASRYSQPQEYEADRHAVQILHRAGYPKDVMIDALAWIVRTEGDSGGGFLSSHPATRDRIRVLRQLA